MSVPSRVVSDAQSATDTADHPADTDHSALSRWLGGQRKRKPPPKGALGANDGALNGVGLPVPDGEQPALPESSGGQRVRRGAMDVEQVFQWIVSGAARQRRDLLRLAHPSSWPTVQRRLNSLRQAGRIRFVGPRKTGYYVVVECRDGGAQAPLDGEEETSPQRV